MTRSQTTSRAARDAAVTLLLAALAVVKAAALLRAEMPLCEPAAVAVASAR